MYVCAYIYIYVNIDNTYVYVDNIYVYIDR